MNTNRTIICRLFVFLLFTTVFSINNAEAQQMLKANVRLICNTNDGGRWVIPAVGLGDSQFDPLEYYDGVSDTYEMSCYFMSNTCYTADTILCNRRGLSDLSELETILVNDNGYVFDGWIDRYGVKRSLSEYLCTNDGDVFIAVWQPRSFADPVFEWSVSINNPDNYQPQSNNGTTSVENGSTIFLQASLIPDIDNSIEFDSWSIEYHTSDNQYFNSTITSKGVSIPIDNANPYNTSGSTTFIIDEIFLYIRGTKFRPSNIMPQYLYTLEIQDVPLINPELQWSASINVSNNYRDYDKNTNLKIKPRESIYLRLCPKGGTVDYDSWRIVYNTKPSGLYKPTDQIASGSCLAFNNGLPYSDFEQIEFEVTNMILYLNGAQVRNIQFDNPYTFTIEKDELSDPVLDLYASINGGSFSLLGNNSNLVIEEGDEIFLRACLSGGNFNYTQWGIGYDIDPSDLYIDAPLSDGTSCITFNNGLSYKDFKELIIHLTTVRLYENGTLIRTIQFETPHIFVVQTKFSGIEVLPGETVCSNLDNVTIPFNLLYTDHKIQYSINFTEEAKKAGFKDIVSFTDLPGASNIVIDMPDGVPAGTYTGIIRLRCDEEPLLNEEYLFSFEVIEDNFEITKQPLTEQSTCRGSLIELSAAISGAANSYQWYYNDQPIPGANSPIYYTDKGGSYYIEITGSCLPIRSQTAIVNVPESDIKIKWNDFLYIENPSGKYERFQWYRNGVAINGATHIYFTDEQGLSGDYTVRSYRSDGTFDETCPVVFSNLTTGIKANVYPSVLRNNESLNIDIINSGYNEQATVEIFSITGIVVHSTQINNSTSKINTTLTKGSYIVKITLSSGKVFNEKIVVL